MLKAGNVVDPPNLELGIVNYPMLLLRSRPTLRSIPRVPKHRRRPSRGPQCGEAADLIDGDTPSYAIALSAPSLSPKDTYVR